MAKEHLGSIHEVMEQQKITMAKGGMYAEIASKVSIVAAMNRKNLALPSKSDNIGIDGSLLSRFDFVFDIEDPRDPVADEEISWHILNESTNTQQPSWNLERLKDHVLVAKEINAEMTTEAEKVLARYCRFCTRQAAIDQSRKTNRLWNSLNRMTICHAKLVMRSKVRVIDALAVVMLMETTWSMGHLGLKQPNAMKATYPLGPSDQIAVEILEKLDLGHLLHELLDDDDEWGCVLTPQPSTSKQAAPCHQQWASNEQLPSTSTQPPMEPRKSGMLSFFTQQDHSKKMKLAPTVSEKPVEKKSAPEKRVAPGNEKNVTKPPAQQKLPESMIARGMELQESQKRLMISDLKVRSWPNSETVHVKLENMVQNVS